MHLVLSVRLEYGTFWITHQTSMVQASSKPLAIVCVIHLFISKLIFDYKYNLEFWQKT